MNHSITKAVFPVAGMGTRFLPATKANPKEMLPIVDKPLIQYAVEEAIAIGVTQLIFVTSSTKRAIEDHFDSNYELEEKLAKSNKRDLLESVRNILPKGVSCAYVRQPEALGLGHAVLCAKSIIGQEPFAVLLADDLIDGGEVSCLEQMAAVFTQTQQSLVAIEEIPYSETHRYGVVGLEREPRPLATIKTIVEKPSTGSAPSSFGVVGRYILDPMIFECLENIAPDAKGEFQLTDAIDRLLKIKSVDALRFSGKRYDCGSKLGYLEATIAYALKHPELEHRFRACLEKYSTLTEVD